MGSLYVVAVFTPVGSILQVFPPVYFKYFLPGIYYCLTLCVTTFTTVMGVLVLQMHFKGRSGQNVNSAT